MESFFSTLKTERLSRKQYRTRDGLRADVFDYIERFYNPKRRHWTIGHISPVQLEMYSALKECVRGIGGSPSKLVSPD
jgi:putative transposase